MRPFVYRRADDTSNAVSIVATGDQETSPAGTANQFLAGGTTLLDLMKLDVMRPQVVVDINSLAKDWSKIEATDQTLRIGALAKMSDVAGDEVILRDYPLIAQSLQLAASQQIRNMATLGGNVLQRTRCTYFRDVSYANCNKRTPGSGCAAMQGFNRTHAVLGTSDQCIATYPGDFAQALIALDAQVEIVGNSGQRVLAFRDLHKPPGKTPQVETSLGNGELITGFTIQGGPRRRSLYLKVRDRESYEFALASAAVALDLRDGVVQDARIALGGVATTPWRAVDAEAILDNQRFSEDLAQKAADVAFIGAERTDSKRHNEFKVKLGRQTIIRALSQAAAMEI